MKYKNFVIGLIVGLVLSIAGYGSTITGFAIVSQQNTINIDTTVSEDTIIPLTTPSEITSLTFTGRYQGLGETTIHLVGPNETYLVGHFKTNPLNENITYVLGKGGTVIRLQDAGQISFDHVFQDECRETCDGAYEGPFYLQIRVTDGSLDVTSVAYTHDEFIPDEVTPTEEEQIPVEVEVPSVRLNPPTECSADTDCGTGFMCEAQYCISQTGHLNITNSSGGLVALFDKHGRILLKGDVYEESTAEAPENAFSIRGLGGIVGFITNTGDLHLSGGLHESVTQIIPSGTKNFLVKNETQYVAMVEGVTGDLYTVKDLASGVLE